MFIRASAVCLWDLWEWNKAVKFLQNNELKEVKSWGATVESENNGNHREFEAKTVELLWFCTVISEARTISHEAQPHFSETLGIISRKKKFIRSAVINMFFIEQEITDFNLLGKIPTKNFSDSVESVFRYSSRHKWNIKHWLHWDFTWVYIKTLTKIQLTHYYYNSTVGERKVLYPSAENLAGLLIGWHI